MSVPLRRLNRKVHIYVGLWFLLFLILFSATGLLLNRHWAFAEFWPQRRVSVSEQAITAPRGPGDVAVARELMRQLGLRGEVASTTLEPGGVLTVQAGHPGETYKIEADLSAGRARVERTRVNGWGVVRTLHTFVGVAQDEPERRRDWAMTKLWSLAIDATAVGIILLVLGGLAEAWMANPKRLALVLAFGGGLAACLAFVGGLIA